MYAISLYQFQSSLFIFVIYLFIEEISSRFYIVHEKKRIFIGCEKEVYYND
jgi:hypothetical protein